ncbi:MAG: hypothetical protein ACI9E1_001894 [Cryomorphaceae bacterium]|jgi:hypothetical protein
MLAIGCGNSVITDTDIFFTLPKIILIYSHLNKSFMIN